MTCDKCRTDAFEFNNLKNEFSDLVRDYRKTQLELEEAWRATERLEHQLAIAELDNTSLAAENEELLVERNNLRSTLEELDHRPDS